MKRKKPVHKSHHNKGSVLQYELEILEGMMPFCLTEIKRIKGLKVLEKTPTAIRLSYQGSSKILLALQRVVAVYLISAFEVPRPKALLGDEHFKRLVAILDRLAAQNKGQFTSFRFSAAGQSSSVFKRLAVSLEAALGLPYDQEKGDLLLRFRPYKLGWQVLTRLSTRPLSARAWRQCNRVGGLNALVAVAMNDLAEVRAKDSYLNAMCGSGTLLIERALAGTAGNLVAFDNDPDALACAKKNIAAARLEHCQLLEADATKLPFGPEFTVITANLPWGDAVGNHEDNSKLYPAFLREMDRIARPLARLIVLTHEIKLFESVLAKNSSWTLVNKVRVFHGGHYPRIYVLHKSLA